MWDNILTKDKRKHNMRIIVLGAGVIGVTTAYFLAKEGHEVVVIERKPKSAMETSFANGGQLSYSHAEPWSHPSVWTKLPFWLIQKDSPFSLSDPFSPSMWCWSLEFMANCFPGKNREHTAHVLRLALYSKQCFREILKETEVSFNYQKKGILHIFRHHEPLRAAIQEAEYKKKLGCDYEVLTTEECVAKEPAFAGKSAQGIKGALFFPGDKTGDIHDFTEQLAGIDSGAGVTFHYNTDIIKFEKKGDKITALHTSKGIMTADAYVVALGSYSPLLLTTVGIRVPIYPLKGYSISIPTQGYTGAPTIGITDQSKKIVYSRLGDMLRVAGTAELAGYNTDIRHDRIDSMVHATKELFPECGDFSQLTSWACLRSSTPDGMPILGETKIRNLYLNTGQGSLGWTLSCGSSKVVTDIICGRTPDIAMDGLTMKRFG
jgi:D-amino-acid dehydrogenase